MTRSSGGTTECACQPRSQKPEELHGQRATKLEVLGGAMSSFKHIIKKVDGPSGLGRQTQKYRPRQINVERSDAVMFRLAVANGTSPSDIFGAWGDWGESWPRDIEARPKEDLPPFHPRAMGGSFANPQRGCRHYHS